MAKHEREKIEVRWEGPFSWPEYERENGLCPLPEEAGVYLWTFDYRGGYLIYIAGLTRDSAPIRFKKHTSFYMKGEYNVLDVAAARRGIRKRIWHGWPLQRARRRGGPDLRALQKEFEERKELILDAVRKQLAGFRVFIADAGDKKALFLSPEPRVLERLEAAIMRHLYRQPPPFCDIPDRGMKLARRRDSENPIIIENECAAPLHRLPPRLEI
jgi:hypothetical protein